MSATNVTRASSLTEEPKTLTAFCASCPEPIAVERVLKALGFRLVFFLPADITNASLIENLPPLPAQYHFEDEVGTAVAYLAGIDSPSLADDEDDPEERANYRYPPHASRFWLTAGGRELVVRRVRDALAAKWNLHWLDLDAAESVEDAA
jgi:hypothetical protein